MRLREIRESKGISQRQAALGLNLSPTVYNRYENGIREPSNLTLLAMADYFGVSVDELLGREAPDQQADQPRTIEAKIISAGIDKMPKEDRDKALNMMMLMFAEHAEYFERKERNEDNANDC